MWRSALSDYRTFLVTSSVSPIETIITKVFLYSTCSNCVRLKDLCAGAELFFSIWTRIKQYLLKIASFQEGRYWNITVSTIEIFYEATIHHCRNINPSFTKFIEFIRFVISGYYIYTSSKFYTLTQMSLGDCLS